MSTLMRIILVNILYAYCYITFCMINTLITITRLSYLETVADAASATVSRYNS